MVASESKERYPNLNYIVYVLCNPLKENRPFYVGWTGKKTEDVNNLPRLQDHLSDALTQPKDCNLRKARTIKEILNAGKTVTTCILPTNSKEEAVRLEINLISLYGRADKNLGPLTNLTDGGDGFRGWTQAQRDHQRKKILEFEYTLEKQLEISKKISKVHKGRKQSPGHVAARSRSMIGKNVGKIPVGTKGMQWFNNGLKSKFFKTQEEAKEIGFTVRGRLSYDRKRKKRGEKLEISTGK